MHPKIQRLFVLSLLASAIGCEKKEPLLTYAQTREVHKEADEVFLTEVGTTKGPFLWKHKVVLGRNNPGMGIGSGGSGKAVTWQRPKELEDVEIAGSCFVNQEGDGLIVVFKREDLKK